MRLNWSWIYKKRDSSLYLLKSKIIPIVHFLDNLRRKMAEENVDNIAIGLVLLNSKTTVGRKVIPLHQKIFDFP